MSLYIWLTQFGFIIPQKKIIKKARKYIRTIFFLLSWVLMYSMNHVILSVLLAFYGELRAMGRQGASGAT